MSSTAQRFCFVQHRAPTTRRDDTYWRKSLPHIRPRAAIHDLRGLLSRKLVVAEALRSFGRSGPRWQPATVMLFKGWTRMLQAISPTITHEHVNLPSVSGPSDRDGLGVLRTHRDLPLDAGTPFLLVDLSRVESGDDRSADLLARTNTLLQLRGGWLRMISPGGSAVRAFDGSGGGRGSARWASRSRSGTIVRPGVRERPSRHLRHRCGSVIIWPGGISRLSDGAVSDGSFRAPSDDPDGSRDRHPTALGRHLDGYLAAVAHELRVQGVIAGSSQRSNPAQRLIGSIVVDCTALRLAAWTPRDQMARPDSRGGEPRPERPAPVVATWDEDTGWCVGMHHDSAHSSRRYLHPDLLAVPTAVADFVVGLALGQRLGAPQPIGWNGPGQSRLRIAP